MLTNYFKIAVRNIVKYKGYTTINLLGLVVGLTCFMIIMLHVYDELSYDRFHDDASRIYRVVSESNEADGSKRPMIETPGALAATLVREMPEVEYATFFHAPFWGKAKLWNEKFTSYGNKFLYVDDSFFNIFSFRFLQGDAQTAFGNPLSVVLTASVASRFFGDEDAIGQTLTFNQLGDKNLVVTGVIKNIPAQSQLQFDFVVPSSIIRPSWAQNWGTGRNMQTYIKVQPEASMENVNTKIQNIADTYEKRSPGITYNYFTQPLVGINGIHFSPHGFGTSFGGNSLYLQVLILVAFSTLLIAGINYVNLATARSATRAKEIGVRKVVGARRKAVIQQFLIESIILSSIAGLVALAVMECILPFFNNLMQKELSLLAVDSRPILGVIIMAIVLFGIFAGLYPAFYLSAFEPLSILQKMRVIKKGRIDFRKALVVSQFALSAFLLVGIIVVHKQMTYIDSADLGFQKDHLLVIDGFNKTPNRDRDYAVRKRLEALPGVEKVGSTMEMEIGLARGGTGAGQLKGGDGTQVVTAAYLADDGFFDVFGLELVEGRKLSPEFSLDVSYENIVVNETTVKQLGIEGSALGHKIVWPNGSESTIVGVVKDFHTSSLREKIFPVIIRYDPQAWYAIAKLSGSDIQKTLSQIEEIWNEFVPGIPLEYYFMDDAINQLYRSERNFYALFSIMTVLCLIIACFGLFGLAAFTAQQRTKEIGVRKVLGATVANVITLLSADFVKLVLMANLIAWPVAWYAMNKWLQNFAYRNEISWWVFALAGGMALAIALLTVCTQAIRAALANPVEALRYE